MIIIFFEIFQMQLSLMIRRTYVPLVVVLLTGFQHLSDGRFCNAQPVEMAPEALMRRIVVHHDKDLRTLPAAETKTLFASLEELFPGRTYSGHFTFRPWYLWKNQDHERTVYWLFEIRQTGYHPGTTNVRISELSEAGCITVESEFSTGWRQYLTGSVSIITAWGRPLIVLGTDSWPSDNGMVSGRQYYAKIGNRFDLVRVEDSMGEASRTVYYGMRPGLGPVPPSQNVDQRVSDLMSTDPFRVLRALVWISSVRSDGRGRTKDDLSAKEAESARSIEKMRMRGDVERRLRELTEDRRRWIREAALMGLEPVEGKGRK